MGRSENTMSTNDEVCTPKKIWASVVAGLGGIDFDPCSHPASTVPALSQVFLPIYSTDDPVPSGWHDGGDYDFIYADGLKLVWASTGKLFLNPPYSQLTDTKSRPSWLGKFMHDVAPDDRRVAFLPVRSACDWWQTHIPHADVLTFLGERVVHENAFWAKDSKDGRHKKGDPITEGAAFSQCLVYRGAAPDVWASAGRELGHTLELWRLRQSDDASLTKVRYDEIVALTHEWGSDTPGDAHDPSVVALSELLQEVARVRGWAL